jgi:hypothetical protein
MCVSLTTVEITGYGPLRAEICRSFSIIWNIRGYSYSQRVVGLVLFMRFVKGFFA